MANSFRSWIGCPLRQSSESRKCITLEHNLTAYAEWMTLLRMELDGDTELDLIRDQGKVELVRRDNPLYWKFRNFLLQKQLPPGRDWADQKFCGLGNLNKWSQTGIISTRCENVSGYRTLMPLGKIPIALLLPQINCSQRVVYSLMRSSPMIPACMFSNGNLGHT